MSLTNPTSNDLERLDRQMKLIGMLVDVGLGGADVTVGERLSYEDERLTQGSAAELAERSFDALSVMLIEREGAPCKEAR